MQIIKTIRFNEELEAIIDFIAADSPNRALKFYDELVSKLGSISDSPFKCRQARCSDDANVRELIFKKYTIPYHINKIENCIVILGIFNQNEWQP